MVAPQVNAGLTQDVVHYLGSKLMRQRGCCYSRRSGSGSAA